MSGIFGILNLSNEPVGKVNLEGIMGILANIGPDGKGIWKQGPIELIHTLLHTTEESEQKQQPLTFDKRTWIIGDVRIDGREELVKKLESKGRVVSLFLTDIELVLHAWHVWQKQLLDHLIGDFAFSVWDSNRQFLFCARDQMGVIPFYYAQDRTCLIFSNVEKCVKTYPTLSERLNEQVVVDYLVFGFNTDTEKTIYNDIKQLPPAHSLTVEDGKLEVQQYWQLPIEEMLRYKKSSDYIDHFKELFATSVNDRLRSPRGAVSMSGGMDSTSVAALAKHYLDKKYTHPQLTLINHSGENLFPGDEEKKFATIVAIHLDTPIDFLHISADDIFKYYNRQHWHPPEPEFTHPPAHQLDIMRKISSHGRVGLTGQGGDPLFLASPDFLNDQIKNCRWMQFVKYLAKGFKHHRSLPRLGIRTKIKNRWGSVASGEIAPPWLKADLVERYNVKERSVQLYEPTLGQDNENHPYRSQAYFDLSSPMWSSIFTNYHSGFNELPVEMRHPFMDTRLISYCLRLPPIPWCQDKHMLRLGMAHILPKSICARPKTGLQFDPFLEAVKQSNSLDWFPPRRIIAPLTPYIDIDNYYKLAKNYFSLLPKESLLLTCPIVVGSWMAKQNK